LYSKKCIGYPTEVFIGQKENLLKISFIQTDNIHTVPKQRLVKYIGTLDEITMREISEKIIISTTIGRLSVNICQYK